MNRINAGFIHSFLALSIKKKKKLDLILKLLITREAFTIYEVFCKESHI